MFNITLPRFKIFFQYTVCTLYSINVQLIKEFDRYFFFLSSASSVTVGWKVENVPMRFSLIFRNWTKICWTFRPNHPAQVSLSTRLTLVDGFRTCWAHNMNYRFFIRTARDHFWESQTKRSAYSYVHLRIKGHSFPFASVY